MSEKVAVTQSYLQDTADAIREKTGSTDTYKPSEFAAAVRDIQSGGSVETCTVNITAHDYAGRILNVAYTTIDETGSISTVTATYTTTTQSLLLECVCNSMLYVNFNSIPSNDVGVSTNSCSFIYGNRYTPQILLKLNASAGSTVAIINNGDTGEPASL